MKWFAVPFALSALLIFWSPSTNPVFNNIWLAVFIWAYYIFYTLYMIPHSALLPEMVRDGGKLVDTKTPLFAEFSALEELLENGFEPPCNVYIGSSHNEELGGDGIPTALKYFQENNIRFEVILDEGGAVIEPPLGGMKCEKCAMVAVHEKGRYRLNFTAAAGNAHASLTSASVATPLERIVGFISEVNTQNAFIRRLNPQVTAMFSHLAPYCGFPMNVLLSNLWLFGGILKKVMPKINAQAGGLIGTTIAFNKIEGSNENKICTSFCAYYIVGSAISVSSFRK